MQTGQARRSCGVAACERQAATPISRHGGNGNDTITPGAGKDKVAANGGDDTISARDGTKDTIDCGAGHDKVTADRTDTVSNCEHVTRK